MVRCRQPAREFLAHLFLILHAGARRDLPAPRTTRYENALAEIQAAQAAGEIPKRPLVKADFSKHRALMLPAEARYGHLLSLPKSVNLGSALIAAMEAIERDFEPLTGQLPKD